MSEKFSFTYFDQFETKHHVTYKLHEYNNLMELLFHKNTEEWGDCKGRAWCGTCHIKIIKGHLRELKEKEETRTLSKSNSFDTESTSNSSSSLNTNSHQNRLACQIPINAELNNCIFRIITD